MHFKDAICQAWHFISSVVQVIILTGHQLSSEVSLLWKKVETPSSSHWCITWHKLIVFQIEVTFVPFCNPRPRALRPVGWVTTDEWLPKNAQLSRSQRWLALLQSLKTPKYGILEAGRLSRDHGVFSPLLFAQTAGSLDLDCFKRSASCYLGCIDEGAIKKHRPVSRMGQKPLVSQSLICKGMPYLCLHASYC